MRSSASSVTHPWDVEASLGEEDIAREAHPERIGRATTAVGLANNGVVSESGEHGRLAMGRSTAWLLMHHVGHRGYDRVPGIPEAHVARLRGRKRRFPRLAGLDAAEAWKYEHNVLHHTNTGELRTPT